MNYYRRYVGDYLRDTATLSLLEHGAYSILLDYYYAEERPISLDLDEVYRMCRSITPEERRAVVKVLTKYFTRCEDGYHNARADHEIEVSRTARDNGGKGGRPRTGGRTDDGTGGETGTKTGLETGAVTGHRGGSGHPPTTTHQPPSTSRQSRTAARAAPPGFDEAFQAMPKRAGNNPRSKAERAYRARIAEKVAPEAILAGAKRYAAFCTATGKVGTEYVLQASTFFGPDHPFLQPWKVVNGAPRWDATDASIMAEAGRLKISTIGMSREALKAAIRARHEEGSPA